VPYTDPISRNQHYSSKDAQLAAVVNPQFKLDWLDDQAEKISIISLLNERVAALHDLEQQIASNAQSRASSAAASESGSGSATTTKCLQHCRR